MRVFNNFADEIAEHRLGKGSKRTQLKLCTQDGTETQLLCAYSLL
jgi:hypothetical protein